MVKKSIEIVINFTVTLVTCVVVVKCSQDKQVTNGDMEVLKYRSEQNKKELEQLKIKAHASDSLLQNSIDSLNTDHIPLSSDSINVYWSSTN